MPRRGRIKLPQIRSAINLESGARSSGPFEIIHPLCGKVPHPTCEVSSSVRLNKNLGQEVTVHSHVMFDDSLLSLSSLTILIFSTMTS